MGEGQAETCFLPPKDMRLFDNKNNSICGSEGFGCFVIVKWVKAWTSVFLLEIENELEI